MTTPPSGPAAGPVFISYARLDGMEAARWLEREIRAAGFDTWRDTSDVDPTADFTAQIELAIRRCRSVVLCLSEDVLREDSFVRREIAYANALRRPIAVVRFGEVELPLVLATHSPIDFHRSTDSDALDELMRVVNRRGDDAAAGRSAPQVVADQHYLESLYREVLDVLDEAVLLPFTGRRGRLLDLTGSVSRSPARSGGALPSSFRRTPSPITGSTVREALESSRGRLWISGAAGAGKTISLLALARDLVTTALTDPDAPIPVLVSAATWGADGRHEGELMAWIGREVPAIRDRVRGLMRAQRIILLIDGMDEVPTVDTRSDRSGGSVRAELVHQLAATNRFVIAGRPEALDSTRRELGVLGVLEFDPLDDGQVDRFVSDLPEVAAVLADEPSIRELTRTPLMLTMLCATVTTNGARKLGGLSPGEARDLVVSDFVESRYARESALSVVPLDRLRRGLERMAMADAGGGGNRNVFNPEGVRAELGSEATELAHRMGVLVVTPTGWLRFLHLTLRDHFAFTGALRAADDPDGGVRDSAAWALWQIPDPRAFDILIRMLDDPHRYARGSAISALGRLGDPRALASLQRLLVDRTPVHSTYGDSISEVASAAISEIREATAGSGAG